jgi:hypothetical protein
MRDLLRMLARRLGAVVAECNYAQRRVTMLKTSPGLLDPSQAPDTYQEFLLETSGPLTHEPSAGRRAGAHPVR